MVCRNVQLAASHSVRYRPINGVSRLLTARVADWQEWDVAPPISLQLVTFITVLFVSVASCLLRVVNGNLQVLSQL